MNTPTAIPNSVAAPTDADAVILAERARRLARPAVEAPAASEFVECVVFALGDERYGLETRFVRAVFPWAEGTRLPRRHEALVGFANLRGAVLAVMDPRAVLGGEAARESTGDGDWLIVVGEESAEFGLVVDELGDVRRTRLALLSPPQGFGRLADGGLARGVLADGLVVLDGERLLAADGFTIEDDEG